MLFQLSMLLPRCHKHTTDAALKMEKKHIVLICSKWINQGILIRAQNSTYLSLNFSI